MNKYTVTIKWSRLKKDGTPYWPDMVIEHVTSWTDRKGYLFINHRHTQQTIISMKNTHSIERKLQ